MIKKAILCLAVVALSASANDYQVSTEVQKKNILIEDFSGVYCQYCPEAAEIIHKLQRNHENFCAITYHAGRFATAEFTTTEGDAIHDHFGASSYPTGMVNRKMYGASYVQSRGAWTDQARTYSQQDAVVNLYATAEGNASTREVTIHVEGYYTGVPDLATNYLCVAMTQSNIVGYQAEVSGGSNSYNHTHVFRQYVSDKWGDAISAAKGEYFSKDYTFKVPKYHKNLDPNDYPTAKIDLKNIEFVVYVLGSAKNNVLNCITVKPQFEGLSAPFEFALSEPQIPIPSYYGFNYFEARLTNKSLEEAKSATFTVLVNGDEYSSMWVGNLPAMSSTDIRIPLPPSFEPTETNVYNISLKKVNNKTATCTTNLSGTFKKPIQVPSVVEWRLVNDDKTDVSYRILDSMGNVVDELGPFGSVDYYKGIASTEYGKTYCFEAYNPWGDGVYYPGKIEIYDDKGVMYYRNAAINYFGARIFFTTSFPAGVDDIEADDDSPVEYYNLNGVKVDQPALAPGLYIEKRGSKATLKQIR